MMSMKKISFFAFAFALLFVACETIEDRDELGSVLREDELVIEVTQETAGSNTIKLKNNTPGVGITPYWDWGTGWSNKNEAEVYIPFAGEYKVTFMAICEGGYVTTERSFTIAKNDDAYFDTDPAWKLLTNGGTGKTWVWATDHPSGKLAGNGPLDCIKPEWWTMTPNEYWGTKNNEVYMDLIGAANFIHTKGDGSIVKGVFNVLAPFTGVEGKSFSSIEVLGGATFPWPDNGKYHITLLNDNELSLHKYNAFDIGLYKRKGFNYEN
jgi:hypothetical protein